MVSGMKTSRCWIKDISQRNCGSIRWESDIVSAFFICIDFHLSLHPWAPACVENHPCSQQECGSDLLFMDQADFTDFQNTENFFICVRLLISCLYLLCLYIRDFSLYKRRFHQLIAIECVRSVLRGLQIQEEPTLGSYDRTFNIKWWENLR